MYVKKIENKEIIIDIIAAYAIYFMLVYLASWLLEKTGNSMYLYTVILAITIWWLMPAFLYIHYRSPIILKIIYRKKYRLAEELAKKGIEDFGKLAFNKQPKE